MIKKGRKTLIFIAVLLALAAFLSLYSIFQNLPASVSFDTSPQTALYVLSKDGITGFSYQENAVQEVSASKFKLLQDAVNPVVRRADLQGRYLLFSEESRYDKNGHVVALDFKEGKGVIKTTPIYAFSSAGQSADYYFVSESGSNGCWIAVYTPQLDLIDTYTFEKPVFGYDFAVDSNEVYMLGVELENNPAYATQLYHFSIKDGRLILNNTTVFDASQTTANYFGDTVMIGENLYALISGTRNLETQERLPAGKIMVHHFPTGQKYIVELDQSEPVNLYELGNDVLAVEYRKVSGRPYGISLLNVQSLVPAFVPLDNSDGSDEEEFFCSAARYDETTVAVLTNKAIRMIDLPAGEVKSVILLPDHIENPFDLWINPEV